MTDFGDLTTDPEELLRYAHDMAGVIAHYDEVGSNADSAYTVTSFVVATVDGKRVGEMTEDGEGGWTFTADNPDSVKCPSCGSDDDWDWHHNDMARCRACGAHFEVPTVTGISEEEFHAQHAKAPMASNAVRVGSAIVKPMETGDQWYYLVHNDRALTRESNERFDSEAAALKAGLDDAISSLKPTYTPAELRRIANILESNDDQPGFDFASAVAAVEAEDMSATNRPLVAAATDGSEGDGPNLYDADTNEWIGYATREQVAASGAASNTDGGSGIIRIDRTTGALSETGRRVYTDGWIERSNEHD